ncbi:conserved hypothetical protein [gamma proteobacterium HTCC5015]|nr:conserved hypothetical protein [gamma proteobacterium HTCC5015]
MSLSAHQRTEMKRLSQILNCEERELQYLSSLEQAELKYLYEQVHSAVSGEMSPLWPALAKSVRFFPNRLCAKITQEALGPYIAAQMTRHLDTKTAIGIGKHFSPQFLAEVLQHTDAAEAGALLLKMPVSTLKKSVLFLLADQQYNQLGQIVEHLNKERILALAKEIDSPRALLQIADSMTHKGRLADAVAHLGEADQLALVEAVVELDMWDAALQLCAHMVPKQQRRLREVALQLEWEQADWIEERAEFLGLSDILAPLLGREVEPEGLNSLKKWIPKGLSFRGKK